jgi:1-acyl-sn-glycerol-3-phosphate acyltransferase
MLLKYFFSLLATLIANILLILFYPLYFLGFKKISLLMFSTYFKTVLFIVGVKVKIEGKENIKKGENYLVASNHQSIFDIPVVGSVLPIDIKMFAKKELKTNFFISIPMILYGYVFVDRSNKRQALKAIKEGVKVLKNFSFLIFPEGTRSKNGKINTFKSGGLSMAKKAGVKILPVGVKETRHIMKKGDWKIHKGTVFVKIFPPINFPENIDRKEVAKQLEDTIKTFVENNVEENYDKTN